MTLCACAGVFCDCCSRMTPVDGFADARITHLLPFHFVIHMLFFHLIIHFHLSHLYFLSQTSSTCTIPSFRPHLRFPFYLYLSSLLLPRIIYCLILPHCHTVLRFMCNHFQLYVSLSMFCISHL